MIPASPGLRSGADETAAALDIDGYRNLLDATFDDKVLTWTAAQAEATERFPRHLIEHLGATGVSPTSGPTRHSLKSPN
jgi:hypothetical protein